MLNGSKRRVSKRTWVQSTLDSLTFVGTTKWKAQQMPSDRIAQDSCMSTSRDHLFTLQSDLYYASIISVCIYIYIYIYIIKMLRTNTVQHTECVQVNMSLDVTGNILDQQALSLDFCPTVQKARTASAATDWQQSCLNLFMVAEQWSWKHPGELQQAEGLIPEHWGTLNNSWSNKGSSPTYHHCNDEERKQTQQQSAQEEGLIPTT